MGDFFSKIYRNICARVAFWVFVLFALVLLLMFLFLKFLLSYSYIENKFFDFTGLKLELIKPETTFDYRFNLNIKANEIGIYDKEKNIKFAYLKNPRFSFKPLGLLTNRIYIKQISADNILININRKEDGKIDLIKALKSDFDFNLDKKIILTRLQTDIEKLEVAFVDDYKIKNKIKFNFKDINTNFSKRKGVLKLSQNGVIETHLDNQVQLANLKLNINSKYPFKNLNSDDVKLDIDINDINLFIFNNLIQKYISKEIARANGLVNIKVKTDDKNTQKLNLKISNPTLILKDNTIISPYKNGLELSSDFKINKELQIDKIKVQAQKLSILSNGFVRNFLTKKPDIDLNIKINDTEINNLIPFIPDDAIFYNPKGILALKKSNFYGLANGEINVKYPLDVTGNLKVENVRIPTAPKPYKQNDVNVRFMNDKMRIFTRVYTPDNEYLLVDGVSNLDKSLYGKYTVKSTSKIDLAFAQTYLVPIQQIIGFNIGPVPIMDISGYGNIDINTQGTIYDAQVFGTFKAYSASATMDGLDAKLTQGNCEIVFDDREMLLKKVKGKLDKADFELTGKGNTKGNVSFNVKIKNAKTSSILKIFKNSEISKPYRKAISNIAATSGNIEADVNLLGTIKDYENKDFLSNLVPSGTLNFKDNKIVLNNGLGVQKLDGFLNFGAVQNGILKFNLDGSEFSAKFDSKTPLDKIFDGSEFFVNSEILSNKIAFSDVITNIKKAKFLDLQVQKILNELNSVNFYSKANLKASGYISLDKFDLSKMKLNGALIGLNDENIQDVKFNSGIIKIENNKIDVNNFYVNYKDGYIKAKGQVYNILSKNPSGDLAVYLDNIKFENIDKAIPKIKAPVALIKNGQILFKNNMIKLNSISLDYGSAPIFMNAVLKDIYSSKNFEGNFSTIIDEQTSDIVINPYLITPIKIVGEIPIKGSIKGTSDNFTVDFNTIIPKGSDIAYAGSNLGDINYKREFDGKIHIFNNIAQINNLRLIKHIANQNGKVNPITIMKANGQIIQNDSTLAYNDFKVLTYSPINVRVLNLLFKKSLLKKGNFDCNITLNDDVKLPKINGKINFYDLDIPLYNTKIDNVKFLVSDKFIDGEILAKNKQSDVRLKIHALNNFVAPFVVKDFILFSNKLDINEILTSIIPNETKIDIVPKADFNINPNDIIIEKGSFEFKDVNYQKISAQNLKGKVDYKNGLIDLKDVNFDIADGKVEANGNYNLKSAKLDLVASMKNCDSNILTTDFLNLPNQIFGLLDGVVSLTAKNINTPQGINSLQSKISFSIDNGKMPKLGSLEYLLRAGNLFKNGIMGLSLNNIIEVLTPYKTGEFEKITGDLSINKGEVEKLNILSKGKNLSLFLDGSYSILENYADIKIYGKLSQNISNALGALGNASINQFIEAIVQTSKNKNNKDLELQERLGKIPSIELENPEPRYFRAKVIGDINKDNYIKSFNWI